jgi:hypothetical protein
MQLSTNAEAALDRWVGPSTWDSNHEEDFRRFYKFVDQYQRDHKFPINESDLRETIEAKVKKKNHSFGCHQQNLVRERVNLACKIIDFLEITGR